MKWPTWQADRRSQLAFGGLLMLLALGLTVAFCSYLLTGQADQSVLSKVSDAPLRESGTEMRNFLGILGAYIAHVFIFRWFG
ncbi:MAG: hypothetical protein EOP49_53515, partial [Sphingobacteriales bacterium]